MLTREFIDGQWVTVDDQFRQYESSGDSSRDYADFMQGPRYADVHEAPTWQDATQAAWEAGYATDPDYVDKITSIEARTPEQIAFRDARVAELEAAGVDPVRAQMGWRQAALETGWGKSTAGGNNYYGIKGDTQMPQQPAAPITTQQLAMAAPSMTPPAGSDPLAGMSPWAGPPMRPTGLDRWTAGGLSSPLAQAGMMMLARPGGSLGGWAQTLGRGLMAGQNAINQQDLADQELWELQQRRMEFQRKQKQWGREDEMAAMLDALPPDQRLQAQLDPAGFAKSLRGGGGMEMKASDIKGLGDNFSKELAESRQASTAIDKINRFLAGDDSVSANATITTLAKVMDPGSVVRTGEGEAYVGNNPLLLRYKQLLKQAETGGFTWQIKNQIGGVVNEIADIYENKSKNIVADYSDRARLLRVNPKLIGLRADRVPTFKRWEMMQDPAKRDEADLLLNGPSPAQSGPVGMSREQGEARLQQMIGGA